MSRKVGHGEKSKFFISFCEGEFHICVLKNEQHWNTNRLYAQQKNKLKVHSEN
jgi:hypothetical protein